MTQGYPLPPPPPPPWWQHPLAILAAAVVVGAGVAALVSDDDDDDGRGDDDGDPPGEPEIDLTRAERFLLNREQGAHFEGLTYDMVCDLAPGSRIESQVYVTTSDGRTRRLDFAIFYPNGCVTAVEAKCVSMLTEAHVRQAEDHRLGVQHSLGARSGQTIVVVRTDTYVSDDHARRVRIVRI